MPENDPPRAADSLPGRLCAGVFSWFGVLFLIASANGAGVAGLAKLTESQPSATNNTPPTNNVANATAQLEGRLSVAREQLAAATVLGSSSVTNLPLGLDSQDVWNRRSLLQRLVRLYEQQLSTAAELQSTKSTRAAALKESQEWTGFSEPRPYSIHLSDRLREELQAERLKIASGESALTMLEQLVEENRKSLSVSEEKLRQFDEELEKSTDSQSAARLTWLRDLGRLRSQTSGAAVAVLDLERSLRQENLAIAHIRVGLLSRQLVVADAGAVFSLRDLDEAIDRLDRERAAIEAELAMAQGHREETLKAWQTVAEKEPLGRTPSASEGESGNKDSAELALRRAELETADTTLRVLRLILEAGNAERSIWEMRYSISESRSSEKLADSERNMKTVNRRLRLWREHESQQLDVSASQVQLQEARVNSLQVGSPLREVAEARMRTLHERDGILLRGLRHIQRLERLTERWSESLKVAETHLPMLGRVKNIFADAQLFLHRLWTFELFSAVDTITVDGQQISGRRSITVGKVILAALILGLGYWVTGVSTRACEPILIQRFKIEQWDPLESTCRHASLSIL